MQKQAPQAPTAPPSPVVVIEGAPGVGGLLTISAPRSARDIDALQARRDELSRQLTSVDGRRSKLMTQLKSTGDPTAVKGLQDRLALLDARQLQLETDLAQTGQALSSASAGVDRHQHLGRACLRRAGRGTNSRSGDRLHGFRSWPAGSRLRAHAVQAIDQAGATASGVQRSRSTSRESGSGG